jgi:shikimate kinase
MAIDDRAIFLVGFMGSGKSAVGEALAARLGRDYADTDRLVVEREGRSVDVIFEQSGEGYFRAVEWECLRSFEGRRALVVAAGGGLFLGWRQRRWLGEQGRTVWLDVPLDVARQRVGEDGSRPLWTGRDPLDFRALFDKRRAIYALAELRVQANPGSAEDVAGRVLQRLGRIFR